MDNKVDDIFKDALGQVKMDPPEEFWHKASEQILARSNTSVASKESLWKRVSLILFVLVGVMSFLAFYFYKQTKSNENNRPTAFTENAKSDAGISNTKSVEASQTITHNSGNKPQNSLVPGQSSITYAERNISAGGPKTASKQNRYSGVAIFNNSQEHVYSANTPPSTENSSTSLIVETHVSKQTVPETSNNLIKDSSVYVQKPTASKNAEPVSIASQTSTDPVQGNPIPAKDTQTYVDAPSGLSVSVFFAPDILDKCLYKGNGESSEISGHDLKNYEKNTFSYSTGVKSEIDLSQHWSLLAGLSYHAFTFKFSPEEVYYQQQSDGEMGYAVVTSSGTVDCPYYGGVKPGDSLSINGTSSKSYIGIPIQIKYRFDASKKIGFYMTAGGAANFAMQSVTTMHWQNSWRSGDATVNSIGVLKNAYYSFYLGFGAEYNLSRSFSIYAEPALQGGITPINKYSPIIAYPYNLSLAFGVIYHLKS